MRRHLALTALPGLCLALGVVLTTEVVWFSLADDTPSQYTRVGAMWAAPTSLVGLAALLAVVSRTRTDWDVNHLYMIAGTILASVGLAASSGGCVPLLDPQSFGPDDWTVSGGFGGPEWVLLWTVLPVGFLLYVLGITPMKYKAKYEEEQPRPSIFDLGDHDRSRSGPPRTGPSDTSSTA